MTEERNHTRRMENLMTYLFEDISFHYVPEEKCVSAVSLEDPEKKCTVTLRKLFDQRAMRSTINRLSGLGVPLMEDTEYVDFAMQILNVARDVSEHGGPFPIPDQGIVAESGYQLRVF